MNKRIVYGVADYEELIRDNGYFVDKTHYITALEEVKNPVFLRPRRFGKSLWCRILECYYNINQQDEFGHLFGHTTIGKHPTPLHNAFIVLHFDFSTVDSAGSFKDMEANFNHTCNVRMQSTVARAKNWFGDNVTIALKAPATTNLELIMGAIAALNLPPLYIIIDEYDNFANQLITTHQDHLYRQLTAGNSFLRTFFKALKEGRKTGTIANTFITGVLPITMDDLTSSYNIASFISLHPHFENMLGFTQTEVDHLLDEVYADYDFDPATRPEIDAIIRNHYNGYHFVDPQGEAVYNATALMYFLNELCARRTPPKRLIDLNLKTDISWVRRLTASDSELTRAFVNQLTLHNTIPYDEVFLVEKFNMYQFFEPSYFPISFFYLGMLTRRDDFHLQLPNLTLRQIFVEYFNELYHIDVSTRYADMMQHFVNQPDLEQLFAGYWREYVSQLPEAIFQQVNENFYRTTFFELCSRYLSRWFTWNVERSYPQGKSDLEFVGKYHERYAGLRWVIEFKYYSNAELARMKTPLANFELQEDDTRQIAGYVAGLQQEYPEAHIAQFVIYCFGNQGFRVFQVG